MQSSLRGLWKHQGRSRLGLSARLADDRFRYVYFSVGPARLQQKVYGLYNCTGLSCAPVRHDLHPAARCGSTRLTRSCVFAPHQAVLRWSAPTHCSGLAVASGPIEDLVEIHSLSSLVCPCNYLDSAVQSPEVARFFVTHIWTKWD